MKPSKKLQQFILQKEFENWADNNKTFIEDIQKLFKEMIMFEIKYGIPISYEIDKSNSQED